MKARHFVAVKAFLRSNDKVLVLREGDGYVDGIYQGKYDLCGGRISLGESLLDGLAREIQEESGLKFIHDTAELIYTNDVTIQKHEETWHITRHFIACDVTDDSILVLGSDHDTADWIQPEQYTEISLIPNLIPAFEAYINWADSNK